MKRFLEHNFPPGYYYRTELLAWEGTLILSVLLSMTRFFSEYSSARKALYISRGAELFLDESKTMLDFIDILGSKLLQPLLLALMIFVIASAVHYGCYVVGSKSIYLMRRLPKGFEMHRRSLLIPFLFLVLFVIITLILLLLYYAVYMCFTPQACMRPDQWQKIWQKIWGLSL